MSVHFPPPPGGIVNPAKVQSTRATFQLPDGADFLDGTNGLSHAFGLTLPADVYGHYPVDDAGLVYCYDANWKFQPAPAANQAGLQYDNASVKPYDGPGAQPATVVSTDPPAAPHPLDSAPVGTIAVKTAHGVVTSPNAVVTGGATPDPTDPIHTSGIPDGTSLTKTTEGIEVSVPLPAGHPAAKNGPLWGVEATVEKALAWIKAWWAEHVEHKKAA